MALIKGNNSFVTVEEAEAYFENRLDVAAWTAADSTQKEKALITATSLLNEMPWTGAAVSESQTLAFPRTGTFFDPMLGKDVEMTVTPARVLKGTYELAYHLLNNDGLLDNTGGVRDLSIGTITLSALRTPDRIPSMVMNFINPLLVNRGAKTWWRAN